MLKTFINRFITSRRNYSPHTSIGRALLLGFTAILIALGGIGFWAGFAPLESAIVTNGLFVANGQNKTVQHLEGGIIEKILVSEGERVAFGQPLIQLERTKVEGELQRRILRRHMLHAQCIRLETKLKNKSKLVFPAVLIKAATDPAVQKILDGQELEFQLNRTREASKIKIIRQRQSAVREEIKSLASERDAVEQQISLISQELGGVKALYERNLSPLSKLISLKRAKAFQLGAKGSLAGRIAKAKERIAELESEILHIRDEGRSKAIEKVQAMVTELHDLDEQIKMSRDVLARLIVRAPVNGVVVKLAKYTEGGVLRPGDEILELLPINEELIVEAYVKPTDRDHLTLDQTTTIRLTALNQRVTPTLQGTLTYISADAIKGRSQGEVFYIARISISKSELQKLEEINLSPGMPVEAHIKTGAHTLAEYLFKPFSDSLKRAFREG